MSHSVSEMSLNLQMLSSGFAFHNIDCNQDCKNHLQNISSLDLIKSNQKLFYLVSEGKIHMEKQSVCTFKYIIGI